MLLTSSPEILCWFLCLAAPVCPTLQPHGLQPTRLLCPWDSPGKSTGVGYRLLLQRIFLIQGSIPLLLHWQVDSLPLSHVGSPQRFLVEGNSALETHGLLWRRFHLSQLEVDGGCWHLWAEAQGAAPHPKVHETAPQQRLTKPQTAPRQS